MRLVTESAYLHLVFLFRWPCHTPEFWECYFSTQNWTKQNGSKTLSPTKFGDPNLGAYYIEKKNLSTQKIEEKNATHEN